MPVADRRVVLVDRGVGRVLTERGADDLGERCPHVVRERDDVVDGPVGQLRHEAALEVVAVARGRARVHDLLQLGVGHRADMVDRRRAERIEDGEGFGPVADVPGREDDRRDHHLAAEGLGDPRSRGRGDERQAAADRAGCCEHHVAEGAQDLVRAVHRVEALSAVDDGAEAAQLKPQLGQHPEVPTAAAQRPRAADRRPRRHSRPGEAAAAADRRRVAVSISDVPRVRGSRYDAVVATPETRGGVAAGTDGERQVGGACGADRRRDVSVAGRANDRDRPFVDHPVEPGSELVVVAVGADDDAALDLGLQLGGIERVQLEHDSPRSGWRARQRQARGERSAPGSGAGAAAAAAAAVRGVSPFAWARRSPVAR